MSSYNQILYHIVFCPKYRGAVLTKENRPRLFQYIGGVIGKMNCKLFIINGVEDHLHIATHVHPSVPLALLVKNIKIASSIFIKENNLFPNFLGWQKGYAAFTGYYPERQYLFDYIKNQEKHHASISALDEYRELLREFEVEFDEQYIQVIEPFQGSVTGIVA